MLTVKAVGGLRDQADLDDSQIAVGVEQAGSDHLAPGVDDLGVGGDGDVRADGADASVGDDDGAVGDRARGACRVNRRARNGHGLALGGDTAQKRGNHECVSDRAHCRVPPVSMMPSMKSLLGCRDASFRS